MRQPVWVVAPVPSLLCPRLLAHPEVGGSKPRSAGKRRHITLRSQTIEWSEAEGAAAKGCLRLAGAKVDRSAERPSASGVGGDSLVITERITGRQLTLSFANEAESQEWETIISSAIAATPRL